MPDQPLARPLRIAFFLGLLILIVPGIVRTYLLTPIIPSAQHSDAIGLAYWAATLHPWLIGAGIILIAPRVIRSIRGTDTRRRMGTVFMLVFLLGLNYLTAFKLIAAATFREPGTRTFVTAAKNKVAPERLVLGLEVNGVAKAYPLNILALHYRISDSIGGTPVLVTYSLLCRTGRVYSPVIAGHLQRFDLVGMQHNNGVLRDQESGTWWYQATGRAAYGTREGQRLTEIPCRQMTLGAWLALHPASLVLQPDAMFADIYKQLESFDHARMIETDANGQAIPWQEFGWVVGLEAGGVERVYDWNNLVNRRVLNDTLGVTPVVIAVAQDTTNFGAWRRTLDGATLTFAIDSAGHGMRDAESGSLWDWNGACTAGTYTGRRLEPLEAHQEYWHTWQTFHPAAQRDANR